MRKKVIVSRILIGVVIVAELFALIGMAHTLNVQNNVEISFSNVDNILMPSGFWSENADPNYIYPSTLQFYVEGDMWKYKGSHEFTTLYREELCGWSSTGNMTGNYPHIVDSEVPSGTEADSRSLRFGESVMTNYHNTTYGMQRFIGWEGYENNVTITFMVDCVSNSTLNNSMYIQIHPYTNNETPIIDLKINLNDTTTYQIYIWNHSTQIYDSLIFLNESDWYNANMNFNYSEGFLQAKFSFWGEESFPFTTIYRNLTLGEGGLSHFDRGIGWFKFNKTVDSDPGGDDFNFYLYRVMYMPETGIPMSYGLGVVQVGTSLDTTVTPFLAVNMSGNFQLFLAEGNYSFQGDQLFPLNSFQNYDPGMYTFNMQNVVPGKTVLTNLYIVVFFKSTQDKPIMEFNGAYLRNVNMTYTVNDTSYEYTGVVATQTPGKCGIYASETGGLEYWYESNSFADQEITLTFEVVETQLLNSHLTYLGTLVGIGNEEYQNVSIILGGIYIIEYDEFKWSYSTFFDDAALPMDEITLVIEVSDGNVTGTLESMKLQYLFEESHAIWAIQQLLVPIVGLFAIPIVVTHISGDKRWFNPLLVGMAIALFAVGSLPLWVMVTIIIAFVPIAIKFGRQT